MVEFFAMVHLNAFTPIFLRQELGVPQDQIGPLTGALAATTFGVAFPLAPIWGSLAERYTRKAVTLRSVYLAAAAYVVAGLAPDLTWFFVSRVLLGLTFGNIAVLIATQSLLTPESRLASAISVVQTAQPIAFSLGPPLGALLIPGLGTRGLFVFDGLVCLASGLLITFFMPEPAERNRSRSVLANVRHAFRTVVSHPPTRWNFAGWFLTRGSMTVLEVYIPVRIAEIVRPDPAAAIGLVLGGYGVATTVFTAIVGRLADRLRPVNLFWPAMILATVTSVGIALAPSLWLIAASTWVWSIAVACTGVVLYAHLSQVVPRAERAPVMSFTPVPRNLAGFVVPLIAAGFALFGTGAAVLVAAGSYGLAVWVGRRLRAATLREKELEGVL